MFTFFHVDFKSKRKSKFKLIRVFLYFEWFIPEDLSLQNVSNVTIPVQQYIDMGEKFVFLRWFQTCPLTLITKFTQEIIWQKRLFLVHFVSKVKGHFWNQRNFFKYLFTPHIGVFEEKKLWLYTIWWNFFYIFPTQNAISVASPSCSNPTAVCDQLCTHCTVKLGNSEFGG
jgi:hypothetical protein